MELFKLLGTIAVDNSEANKEIKETASVAEETEGKMGKSFAKIGDFAAKCGKAIAVGLAAGTAAMTALAKDSLGNYAEYEQLVGGVETLFKDSSGKVMAYADNAYKTAGLSANEYMSTVTSFSASLLQSLGNDTEKAVEYADMAITDMSDNANKMGTDMTMIQNAYQGFTKQNYTMLDNLKLGYGGTKEEMARLLEDATAISGIEYDMNKFADVVEAIHIIQTEIGITGTTAKEASSTIQGSAGSVRASWQNLITGIADDNQDLDVLIDNFIESSVTAVGNSIPRIEKILGGIGKVIEKLAPIISKEFPPLFKKLAPPLVKGAVSLTAAVVKELPTILKSLKDALVDTFPSLFEPFSGLLDFVIENLDRLAGAVVIAAGAFKGFQIVQKVTGFIQNFFGLIAAHPFVAAAAAVGTLVLGLQALTSETENEMTQAEENIAKIREENEERQKNIQAVKDQMDAVNEKAAAELVELDNTEKLWKELQTLCDEQGKVKEADKARADFILNELNTALGTEYKMTGQQIQNYKDLKTSVNEAIEAKKAEILLAAQEEKYAIALENVKKAEEEQLKLRQQLVEQSNLIREAEAEYAKVYAENVDAAAKGGKKAEDAIKKAKKELDNQTAALSMIRSEYYKQRDVVESYYQTISDYEEASTLMLQGNTEAAIDLLNNLGNAYKTAEDLAAESVENRKKILEEQVVTAAQKVAILEEAVANSNDELKKQYERSLQDAKEHFNAMVIEAEKGGGDIMKSLGEGANEYTYVLGDTLQSTVNYATSKDRQYWNDVLGIGDLTIDTYVEGLQDEFDVQEGNISELGADTVDTIVAGAESKKSSMISAFSKLGGFISEGIAKGITDGTPKPISSIISLVQQAAEAAKKTGEIHSPSRLFAREVGQHIPSGVGMGIEDNADAAIKPVEHLVNDMVFSPQKATQTATGTATTSAPADSSRLEQKLEQVIEAIKNLKVYLNGDVLVGELTPALDTSLGEIYEGKTRGR